MTDYSLLRKELQAKGECPEWYTTAGLQLFYEKYSYKGETPKQRYMSIAKAMAQHAPDSYPCWWDSNPYTQFQSWEGVFFKTLWDGYISPSTPLLANGGIRKRGTTVSCLTAESPILVKHGGMKQIKDVDIGDEVLTHKGRWRKVTDKQSRMSDKDLYLLTVDTRSTPLKITGNHPVLTNEGWVKVEDLDVNRHFIATNSNIEYTEEDAYIDLNSVKSNLNIRDSIATPINKLVKIDKSLSWALGLWFAEGSLNICDTQYGRTIRITMAQEEKHHLNLFGAIIKEKFGANYKVADNEFNGRKWATCTVNSIYLANYFGEVFGTSCLTKTMPRSFIDMPRENVEAFLKGLYEGDGRKSAGSRLHTPDIRLSNSPLIAQLYEMSLKTGLKVSLQLQKKDGRNNKNPYASLTFFNGGLEKREPMRNNTRGILFGKNRYCKFKLEEVNQDEEVYDITVDEDESFSVAGVVVHNCAGGYIGNNLYDRYNAITEAAILTKHSHGTSYSIDDWPYEGQKLKRGGRSLGTLPLVRDLIACMEEVTQASRRGSLAYSLSMEHGDFWAVLDNLYKNPESNNVGWLVKDGFVQKLSKADEDAIKRFNATLGVKLPRGKGYYTFIDKMNRHLAGAFKRKGMTVKASNLCVAPETMILTDSGYRRISELEDQDVDVWNGKEWSSVRVIKTGENQELITVKTSAGLELTCTPYHKFYIVEGYKGKIIEKRAHELQQGDKLIKLQTPVIEGNDVLSKPYENGFFSGDGCYDGGKSKIYLYGEKRKLIDQFTPRRSFCHQPEWSRISFHVDGLQPKFFVPDSDYTVESRIKWLEGLLDSDGCLLTAKEGTQSIQVVSTEGGFLEQIQMMLHTLGVHSKVTQQSEGGIRDMPANDGTGGSKQYYCQPAKRLLIGASGILQLLELGLNTERLEIKHKVPNRECSAYTMITDVMWEGRFDDTYCFNEPKRHRGVFNGLLTGQCQETCLPADEDYTFSCVILCYNLEHYRSWPENLVFIGQVMSDCNISEYLATMDEMSSLDKEAMKKIYRFTKEFRALGSGVLGLHTLFQQESIVVGDMQSIYLNYEIFKHLDDESKEATEWLAEVLGEPDGCEGMGIRNATRLMMPPTKSTAEIMAGASEGIGMDVAMAFTKQSAGGEFFRINKVLLKLMKERGVYTDENIMRIAKAKGSVQGVDWLNEHEKKVFRTAFEIPMEYVLRLASQRQRFIDQAQSLNLYFTSNDSEEYIGKIHRMAFEDENILSLYYIYSVRGADGLVRDLESCEACQ